MARQLLPYEQGHLDGLCGLYSIVNATQFALRTAEFERSHPYPRPRYLSEHEAELMFMTLIRGVIRPSRLIEIFVDGIHSRQLAILLRLADRWLHKRRATRLFASRPFYRCGRIRSRTVLRRVGAHLATPGTAVIVGTNPPWRHWTVATRLSGSRLHLFDSGGYESVPLRLDRHSARLHAGLIKPSQVFFVSIEPAHQ
jgi:hypothetical protein